MKSMELLDVSVTGVIKLDRRGKSFKYGKDQKIAGSIKVKKQRLGFCCPFSFSHFSFCCIIDGNL